MRRIAPDLGVSGVVALVVLGPLLLGGGFWILGDMVFVPDQHWRPAWLGLDGALPRAVPMDALVSIATTVLPGALVQKALLVGGFVAGGLGIARVVGEHDWWARAAAITLFCWNPWVYERLLIGQWAILLGYLLLPWVAVAARRMRRDPTDSSPAAVALVLAAACSPSSGLMAAGVLAVLALGRDRRGWWRVPGLAVVANLTWLVPALAADTTHITTDGVFEGFAARGESGAGLLASLLSLGGIWKTSILPGERESAALVLLSCALSVAALVALWRSGAGRGRWLALGALAFAVALLPALAPGLFDAAGERVPVLALLRDSHRFLAPLGLVLAVGVAHASSAVATPITAATRGLWSVVGLLVVAPALLLPSLAWGAAGELERSSYPQEWSDVGALVGDDDVTVVLPWGTAYRSFDWNHRRAVLDPAPRFLRGTVLIDDTVRLERAGTSGAEEVVVPSEDPRVLAVDRALSEADPASALRALGVRWVLAEQGMVEIALPDDGGDGGGDGEDAGAVAHQGDQLTLVDLAADGEVASGPTAVRPEVPTGRQIFVISGHGLAILLLLAGAAGILRSGSNERHTA